MADKDRSEDAIPLRSRDSLDELGSQEGDSLVGRDGTTATGDAGAAAAPKTALAGITNSPPISILAYCLASISMTVVNKFVVSGASWNLTFFYLAAQVGRPQSSMSCVPC